MIESGGENQVEKKKTILVVDDEWGVRDSFDMVLSNDYNVFLAESGEEAIEIFKKNSIDLILLDIMLPNINGLDLLKRFKELDPNCNVIMVSAVKDVETAIKAMKYGAYDYLVKPFIVEDIKRNIESCLSKRYLESELNYYRSFVSVLEQKNKILEARIEQFSREGKAGTLVRELEKYRAICGAIAQFLPQVFYFFAQKQRQS